jgi:CheY-like chemotaxis protein
MKHKRILIVDDNEDAADSLRLFLEMSGFNVRTAYSGQRGLKAAIAWLPDAVLSDIGLPGGLDGWDLASKLRHNESTAGCRLIAISAYSSDEARHRSGDAGFECHLQKPVDPQVLVDLLGRTDEE